MKPNIQIEKPCAENFNAMTSVSGGKFCGTCETKVIDFTKMSLNEIEDFFKNASAEKICGRYNQRHTDSTISNISTLVNKFENWIYNTRFRKVAVWTISIVFFLLNSYKCMGKRVEPSDTFTRKNAAQKDTVIQSNKNH